MAELVLEEALKGSTVDPVEEPDTGDYAGDYLLGRQVSREMNDPVNAMALDASIQSMVIDPRTSNRYSPYGYFAQPKPEAYLDVNKITYTKKPEVVPGVDYTTPSDTVGGVPGGEGGDFVGSLRGSSGPAELSATATHEGLGELTPDQISGSEAVDDAPIADPGLVTTVAGGAGVVTSLQRTVGTTLWRKLVPSLARGVTNAAVSGAAEYGYAAATGMAGDRAPDFNPLIFNVALGVVGGLTLETYAVNQLEKMAMRGAKSAFSPQNVVAAIRSGDFNNPVARKIAEGWANHVENESGLFFGAHAKTLDVPLFNRIKEAVENGADRKKVRLATGFFQPEKITGDTVEYGKWRWEVSDKNYRADIGKLIELSDKNSTVYAKDFVTHPELFAAYPEKKDITVKVVELGEGRKGSFDTVKNIMYINRSMAINDPRTIQGTILHEFTHPIQKTEGFTQGTNLQNVEFEYPKAYAKAYADLKADQASMNRMQADATRLNIDVESVVRANASFITYKNVGGEVEARDGVERWMFEESMKMENLEPAKKLFNEFTHNTKKQMNLFTQEMDPDGIAAAAEGVLTLTKKMREMGYDLNNPDIFRAFETGDFKYTLPEPALLRYAKTIVWPEEHLLEGTRAVPDPRYRKLKKPPVKGVTIMPNEEISSAWDKAIKRAEDLKDSSDIRYINEKQYARDMAERGIETPEMKVARKTLQERDSSIIEQMRNANPPPSLTDKSFFTKPRDEQQAIMQAWREGLQAKISKALGEYTPEEIEIANKTSRSSGAVGGKAITPKYVRDTSEAGERILDFGAGKDAIHAKALKDEGLDVTAYEFGANVNPARALSDEEVKFKNAAMEGVSGFKIVESENMGPTAWILRDGTVINMGKDAQHRFAVPGDDMSSVQRFSNKTGIMRAGQLNREVFVDFEKKAPTLEQLEAVRRLKAHQPGLEITTNDLGFHKTFDSLLEAVNNQYKTKFSIDQFGKMVPIEIPGKWRAIVNGYGAGTGATKEEAILKAQKKNPGADVTAEYVEPHTVSEGKYAAPDKVLHDPDALSRQYDTVYASNVLNVQSNEAMLRKTLEDISLATADDGRAVFNYPVSPRKAGLSVDEVERIIEEVFPVVKRVGGTTSAPLWEAKTFDDSTSWMVGIKGKIQKARELINPEGDYALFKDGSPSGSLEPSLLPKPRAVSKLKENLTKPQTVQLFSMGPGAMAGIGYDEETKQVTFSPEKAIVGMVLSAGTMKMVGGKIAKGKSIGKGKSLGKGITTGGQGGRYLRGTFDNVNTSDTVAKNLDDSVMIPVWDSKKTVAEALEHAKNMTYLKAEIIPDKVAMRWSVNENGAYGNDKMAYPSGAYPAGRNTYDIPGCGRETWARENGVEQTYACYGEKCYAETDVKQHGRGSVSGGNFWHGLHWNSPLRKEITQSMKDIGLEATQKKYPELLIQHYPNKGFVWSPGGRSGGQTEYDTSKLSIKAKTYSTKTASVSTNLMPAKGQDIRLGVDTDGSAWLSEPEVMNALLGANPRSLSVYSSCYFAPPVAHPLSGRTMINVTVSGWHPLAETLHRLEWAQAARANGWNVILREVTADPSKYANDTVNLYNRLHKSLMKTDFFLMEQPLHSGATHGNPIFGLPGCCKADKENPWTCDNCEVAEGFGLGFQKYWGIKEGAGPTGKVAPDVNQGIKAMNRPIINQDTTEAVINRAILRRMPDISEDVTSPFADIPVAKFRFDPTDLDLPFKDKSVLEEMANINFNNILDENGIQDAIAQVGRIIESSGAGEVMRRGTQSNRSTAFKAVNPHLLAIEDLIGRKPGQMFNPEEAVRARYFLVSSAQNLVGVAQKAAGLSATDLDKVAFVKALNLHGAIQAQVSGMTAEAGRLLNSFNIMAKSTQGITREVKNVLEALPGGMSVDEMAHFVSTLSTPVKVGKFVTKIQHASTIDMVVEAWINSLLSGPTTHAVNMASNSLAMLLQLPERWAAGQFARALGHEASVVPGETSQMVWGLIEGFRDGLKSAGQVIRTGEATDIMSKVEKPFQKSITSANVRALSLLKKLPPSVLEEGGMTARAIDLLGEAMRIPTTALQAEDSFFKGIGYRMELRARSYRDAVQKYPDDIEKQQAWMQKVMEDPETHAPDIAVAAQNFSRYATFTNDLGKYGKGLQQLASHPVMRFIIPFVRTPTNILKFGMERTPFGIIKVIRAGTEAERDLALARMSLGSLAMASTVAFASGGFITGGGPTDPERQAALRRTGWQPYSLHIGDKYYSFSRIEPLGMTLGLAADFAEMSALATTDYEGLYEDFGDLGTAIVASIAKNVTSKTWLKGLSAVTMIPSNPEYYGKKWIEGLVGSFVPTLSANVEKAIDPELSAVWGMIDALKARIPGMSRDLPPKRDFWGEPVGKAITENNWLQGLYSMASPVYISESNDSPIDKELVRLKIGLPNPKKSQNIRGIDVPLDSLEYDDFIVKRNQVPVLNGKNLKDSLDYLVGTSQYKEKRAEVKEDMIKDLVQAATDRAKEALYQGNSTLRQYVDQQTMARQREAQ